MKYFRGKAIYNPSGKAGEYSYWACNFYTGCSNNCEYCYCKKGVLSSVWSNTPQLKKCFNNEIHAYSVFKEEVNKNIEELKKTGLFFSFTTDPLLVDTRVLTVHALAYCNSLGIPVKILTKMGPDAIKFIFSWCEHNKRHIDKSIVAFGFTLTGYDNLEPYASTNAERIKAMKELHNVGFKTFASIEPIIDFESSEDIMRECQDFCDLFKVGLMSGKKYKKEDVFHFVDMVLDQIESKIYFKDSLLQQAGIERKSLPSNCVDRDYNIFQNN